MKRTIRTVPRIRTVKPELFRHEGLFDAEIDSQLPLRLAFIALITCCDREGRFRWQPRRLKADMLPFDNLDMMQVLEVLTTRGFIMKYEHQGEWYGCIPSWYRHQRINKRESVSILPAHPDLISFEKQKYPLKTVSLINAKSELTENCDKSQADSEGLPKKLKVMPNNILNLKTSEEKKPPCIPKKSKKNNQIKEFSRSRNCLPASNEHDTARAMHVHARVERKGREGNGKEEEGIGMEGEENNTIVASEMRPGVKNETIQQIFSHWKTVMNHPNAKLDPKRKALIQKALSFGYGVKELCEAINGCSITPHNMGDNDRNQRYDGLHVILRDADQIDRFIHHYHCPPRPKSLAEKRTQANVETLKRWANKKMAEEKLHASK